MQLIIRGDLKLLDRIRKIVEGLKLDVTIGIEDEGARFVNQYMGTPHVVVPPEPGPGRTVLGVGASTKDSETLFPFGKKNF